jgi:spore maturation protein CgeB
MGQRPRDNVPRADAPLGARGHQVLLLERDLPWYAQNRDTLRPEGGRTELYGSTVELKARFAHAVRGGSLIVVGSYVPEGIEVATEARWDLGYLGTYSDDRQPSLDELLLKPARELPDRRFVIAGAQYPPGIDWPDNVGRITHLPQSEHREFYNSQRYTLNLTRAHMIKAGWSPSVRLFEAAACGTPIISDWWEGLDDIFEPGEEILVARSADDVAAYLHDMPEDERRPGKALQPTYTIRNPTVRLKR